ncbi:MAG: hypothetical protein M3Q95_04395 [Bacteroidota bacterium]|nr:hypothetical protein [Bacteroidota bacterium]
MATFFLGAAFFETGLTTFFFTDAFLAGAFFAATFFEVTFFAGLALALTPAFFAGLLFALTFDFLAGLALEVARVFTGDFLTFALEAAFFGAVLTAFFLADPAFLGAAFFADLVALPFLEVRVAIVSSGLGIFGVKINN